MKYEISKYDKHYFLYAKGWYKKTDLWEDLKIIQGNYCYIEPKYITKNDIIQKLLDIAVNIMLLNSNDSKRQVISFINGCRFSEYWKVNARYSDEAVVLNALSLMCYTKTEYLNPEKDCDFNLLSKKGGLK